jgi:hypothetical protein
MSRFKSIGSSVYEKGDRIGCTPDEAAVELARKLNAYQMRVARLKAEVERLTAIVGADAIDREHGMCCDASAQVERLTKAGDALENWIAWVCESPVGTAAGVRDAWDAAKEGKQP